MRKIGAAFVVLALIAPNAFAAGSNAPLLSGKPAGVKEAQALHPFAMWVAGLGLVGGGLLLATAGKSNNSVNTINVTATTTTTHP